MKAQPCNGAGQAAAAMNAPTRCAAALPACSRRALLGAAAGLAAAAVLPGRAAAQAGESRAPPLPPVGTRLDLPELTLLDGRTLRSADLAGQVVVVYWWASWCPFCAMQSPLIDQLQRMQGPRGLRVVGLSIDKKPDDAAAHLAKKGYGFASAWVSPALARALPKPKGLPVTVVLGRDGRVVMSESGQLFAEDIEDITRFL
jgi:thiol-disulfide isomerase/thioredoxin